jgi:hypothetical protein
MIQASRPAQSRRLVTLPVGAKVPIGYGCTGCYWRYDPKGASEVYEAATLLSAQVLFGIHDCHKFRAPSPDGGKGKEKGHAA